MGAPRRGRRARLRADLRRRPGQEEEGQRAEEAARVLRRAPARDGRRPRGRGDRLASDGGAEAEGSGAPDGLPRDHPRRDRARARRDARRRPAARRRAGDAAHPRPALRLRGLAGPLEEDHARSFRRPRAVRRDAARRRARARADEVRVVGVVGPRGDLRSRVVRGAARRARRKARRAGSRLRAGRKAEGRGRAAARRVGSARARRAARGRVVQRLARRAEAVRAPAEPAVHDVDAAAGGEPEAPLHRADDDARRAAPLRERLHHVHAHRLDDAVGVGAAGGARAGGDAVRSGVRAGAAATLRAQGEERAGSARGDPPVRRCVPHAAGGRARAEPRRAPPLRADLDPHRRVADGGRSRARRSRSGSAARRPRANSRSSARPAP